ncbi:MAG: Thiamine-monophosphate kinase [Firmicutes bacterium]|nr:Thiamine-monophosphate kinase [candidate division NPL-UPA2 bacterium]
MSLETEIIEWLRARPPERLANPFPVDIEIDGATTADDDCVVIDLPGAFSLVVGTDFVRGTGFRLFHKGKMSLNDVGYYLVAANASDLAAMGAVPLGFLDVFRYSKEMTLQDVQTVLAGISEACAEFRMRSCRAPRWEFAGKAARCYGGTDSQETESTSAGQRESRGLRVHTF